MVDGPLEIIMLLYALLIRTSDSLPEEYQGPSRSSQRLMCRGSDNIRIVEW